MKAFSVQFKDAGIRSGLKHKNLLKLVLFELIQRYRPGPFDLQYTFVTDEFLATMNRDYLAHDTYTDIITFDLTSPASEWMLGDIYISVERVRDNAKLHSQTYNDELHRVILHGALHLCGFGDKTKSAAKKMRQLEDYWLEYLS